MLRSLARRIAPQVRRLSTIPEPGPVGLATTDNPRQLLTDLYNKTLEAVKEFPEDAAYRKNVEKITKYRMGVVNGNEDVDKIAAILKIGQIPEIIEQAENELELIPHMAEWKPWEMKGGQNPAVIEVVD